MAWEADVEQEPARMRCGMQGHVVEPREPTQSLGGVDAWHESRESTWTPGWRHVASDRAHV